MNPPSSKSKILHTVRVFYDGECPFCSRYAEYQKLSDMTERLELLDMRSSENLRAVAELNMSGFSPGDGIIVQIQETPRNGLVTLQGADAMKALAVLDHSGRLGSYILSVFKIGWLARVVYPALKFGRLVTLKVLKISLSPLSLGHDTSSIRANNS